MRRLLCLGLLLAVPAAAEVQSGRFASSALGREVSYAVDLPPSYAAGGDRRYPVVYALHGLFEGPSFWEGRGLAAALARLRGRGGSRSSSWWRWRANGPST